MKRTVNVSRQESDRTAFLNCLPFYIYMCYRRQTLRRVRRVCLILVFNPTLSR